tara:strand:+ start:2795 stop:3448 length:654 start_codon:yes stop_codon:yes gene_type:complete
MGLFDGIFGTPNKDKANAQQRNLMHNQLARGNQLHNLGTSSVKFRNLAIRKYTSKLSNDVFNANIKAQGKVYKTTEYLRQLKATSGSVVEAGRSRTGRRGGGRSNEGLMLLSKLYQAENLKRFTSGERASAIENSALLELQSNEAKAIAKIVGVGATPGFTYTKDNNALKFAKLAISVATGDFGGAFGTMEGGGNASLLQAIGGGDKYDPSTGWLTG